MIAVAQLMVILDATIVSIALPSAQADLEFSDASRQWMITAYSLSFGSLLLLGGRISDIVGRKRMFIAGLFGFAIASAIGGAAPSFEVLIAARALQGVFAAVLGPSALSTLTTVFEGSPDRGKAFGIFGAIAGGGGAVGLMLGGVLTEYLSWRWCMYVNLAFALPAALAAFALLYNRRAENPPRIDIPGALAATAGLFALVYGLSEAERDSWTATLTLICFSAFAVLLVAFVLIEARVADPLLPLRVVVDRVRGTSFFAVGTAMATLFGSGLFLTYYFQEILGMTPVQAGLAFLPQILVMMATGITSNTLLLPRFGPRPLLPIGMILGALSMAYLTQIDVDSSYWSAVLPALLVLGLGMALMIAPAIFSATLRVPRRDTGVASAMVNTSQQIGGAIGTALYSTIAASATASFISGPPTPGEQAQAAVHGYTVAFWVAAGLLVFGALVTAVALRDVSVPKHVHEPESAPVA